MHFDLDMTLSFSCLISGHSISNFAQWYFNIYTRPNNDGYRRHPKFMGILYTSVRHTVEEYRYSPLNTWRNNDVVITSKRRHCDVITSQWRRFDVITTSFLRNVSAGRGYVKLLSSFTKRFSIFSECETANHILIDSNGDELKYIKVVVTFNLKRSINCLVTYSLNHNILFIDAVHCFIWMYNSMLTNNGCIITNFRIEMHILRLRQKNSLCLGNVCAVDSGWWYKIISR